MPFIVRFKKNPEWEGWTPLTQGRSKRSVFARTNIRLFFFFLNQLDFYLIINIFFYGARVLYIILSKTILEKSVYHMFYINLSYYFSI